MKKDEIIELLKEQLRVANDTVSSLTTQVNELIERIKSLEELLVQKGIAIDKANLEKGRKALSILLQTAWWRRAFGLHHILQLHRFLL